MPIFALELERNIFKKWEIIALDGSSGEDVSSGDQGRSPRTFFSADPVLLGLRMVMASYRSLDLGHAAAISVSQISFILGDRKLEINQQYSLADSQRDFLSN